MSEESESIMTTSLGVGDGDGGGGRLSAGFVFLDVMSETNGRFVFKRGIGRGLEGGGKALVGGSGRVAAEGTGPGSAGCACEAGGTRPAALAWPVERRGHDQEAQASPSVREESGQRAGRSERRELDREERAWGLEQEERGPGAGAGPGGAEGTGPREGACVRCGRNTSRERESGLGSGGQRVQEARTLLVVREEPARHPRRSLGSGRDTSRKRRLGLCCRQNRWREAGPREQRELDQEAKGWPLEREARVQGSGGRGQRSGGDRSREGVHSIGVVVVVILDAIQGSGLVGGKATGCRSRFWAVGAGPRSKYSGMKDMVVVPDEGGRQRFSPRLKKKLFGYARGSQTKSHISEGRCSMALKVLVDQAVDDEAFWGALTNDTTHPVLEYLRQLPTAAEGERPVKGDSYNDLAVFGDCWNDYLRNPKAKIIFSESKTAASSAGPQPPAPSGSVVGGASAVKQGADKVNAVAETKLKEKQKEKEHEKEKEKKDKAKDKDKDKGLDKGKGNQKQKQKQNEEVRDKGKRGAKRAAEAAGREVAKKKKVSDSALESESASESEKETSRPKPKPRMVHPAASVAKDVAAPVEATPAAKPKAKNVKEAKIGGDTAGKAAVSGQSCGNMARHAQRSTRCLPLFDTLVLGLAGFRAFLEGIEARMGESGPEFVAATEALATKTAEILESRQKMAEALEDMQQGDEDDEDEDEELKNAMRSHVKTVDSVYETLNNTCRASNANTQALQYTIAGLVAFMRLSAPIVALLHQR
ncbi:hypothetical protein FA13DRAFT_1715805 [Coprinellus micaceus]|uniref:Uncharacterized protein n=1 Tax=Coprinellus micaceus TaxID=71717 RepID=A0A4Y7SM61_COPMI|nr:hypothetical protein FA13DRAFT_1715805 [Coprinellus micaceus]